MNPFTPRKDLATGCCSIPLFITCLLFIVFALLSESFYVYQVLVLWDSGTDYARIARILAIVFQGILILCALVGLLAKSATVLKIYLGMYAVFYIFCIVLSIYQVVIGIVFAVLEATVLNAVIAIILLIVTSILQIFFLWYFYSCFASLQKVYEVGGNGWEQLNYEQILVSNEDQKL